MRCDLKKNLWLSSAIEGVRCKGVRYQSVLERGGSGATGDMSYCCCCDNLVPNNEPWMMGGRLCATHEIERTRLRVRLHAKASRTVARRRGLGLHQTHLTGVRAIRDLLEEGGRNAEKMLAASDGGLHRGA